MCVFLYFLSRCPHGQQRIYSKEKPFRPQLTGSQTGAPPGVYRVLAHLKSGDFRFFCHRLIIEGATGVFYLALFLDLA